jgi:cell division septation protein DedD
VSAAPEPAPEAAPEVSAVPEAAPEAAAAPVPAPEAAAAPAVAPPEPAAEAPPSEPLRIGSQAPAPEAPPAVAVVPSTPSEAASTLVRKSFYLQLGAYSTRNLAEKLASQVSTYARYSVEILPTSAGAAPLYKVLIGPLNRDESGTLLYQFRARGFRDAFVQYVE